MGLNKVKFIWQRVSHQSLKFPSDNVFFLPFYPRFHICCHRALLHTFFPQKIMLYRINLKKESLLFSSLRQIPCIKLSCGKARYKYRAIKWQKQETQDHVYGVLLLFGNLFKQLITVFWKENLPQYAMHLSFMCHGTYLLGQGFFWEIKTL